MKKVNRILLIDDSKAVNNINESILESMDLFNTIEKYSNPDEAIAFFKNTTDFSLLPDIIFLDIEMPEMTAFEFLNQYSKIESIQKASKKPYIVIVSDHLLKNDNMDASKRYWPEGVADQILKPLEKEDIAAIVEGYFESQEN